MHQEGEIIARIMNLVHQELCLAVASADMDVVEAGIIDSFAFMELFIALEEEFGIEITVADLELNHFRSVQGMALFVISKKSEILEQ